MFPVALQMYTARNELEKDYFGTLSKVGEIGYQGVELELPPAEIGVGKVKAFLDQHGLSWVGCHVEYEQLASDPAALIAALKAGGIPHLVLSYLEYPSRQDVLDAAALFNRVGKDCQAAGIQFSYHNHNHEFIRYDGDRALDILIEETDPSLVTFELDTYWIQRAGIDPVEYLRRLQGRCPLLHIKDMEPGAEQFYAEIGEGVLDFPAILREAQAAGVQWLIVEQDECRKPVFESIKISYDNLAKMT